MKSSFFKRLIDLCLAISALLILSPVLLIVFALVLFIIGSPAVFVHVRPGRYGKPFKMYKFRTMTNEVGADGELLSDAQRITKFGAFLRSTSLDEVPELFNVLKGDMSLVGPRPLLMEYLPLYNAEQAKRHDVLPGITGWAQVNGRNAIDWKTKLSLDVWYVENWNIWLDLRIMVITIYKAIKREGLTEAGVESKFRGG